MTTPFTPFARPSDRDSGDTFPFFRDGVCHLFHMMPPVIAHHESTDLVHWRERPIVVSPGKPGEPDAGGVATGSVVEHEGKFYLFYTGNQNVCLATSDDLNHWVKHPASPLLAGDDTLYAKADFRDPFVFFNEAEQCWWLLVGTRVAGVTPARGGCVGLAKSHDLLHWTAAPPLWAPAIGPHCDCPQLLRVGENWRLLYLQRNTRVRIADEITGPFRRPTTRSVGTSIMAAGSRPAFDGRRWLTFPFITSLQSRTDLAPLGYGGPLAVPRVLDFHDDGSISEKPAEEMLAAVNALPDPGDPLHGATTLAGRWNLTPRSATSQHPSGGTLLLPAVGPNAYIEFALTLDQRDSDFHLLLRTTPSLTTGYQLALHPRTSQVSFRSISQWDTDRVLVSRSVTLPVGRPVPVQVFLSGSVMEVFIDRRASLTSRVYDHATGSLGLEFRDGTGSVNGLSWRALGSV